MANNKDKIRASAQKFLQKGQIDKAIREFQRLVEEDPKDVRTLLKIGDLQTRIGSNSEATQTYGLVAQFYADQGFFLKAVAVYKQILKLDPNLIDINVKLAELYHQLGLMSDAAAQYRQISQIYEQAGRIDDSIKVLVRMVQIDPENVASRIKLAETYAKQNKLVEARSEFGKAADFLQQQHRVDDYIKVAERIIFFDSGDLTTTKELANIYIQKGDARRALAKLQVCFKANPKDVETLSLLATAFKDLQQPAKTVSVYREIARIHEAAGDTASFQSVMRRILAIDPDDAEARKALGSAPQATAATRAEPAGAGPSTPPPRRPTVGAGPSPQALAMPTRRVTGEVSPAQIAAMQAIAAQGAARRGTGDVSPAQLAGAVAQAPLPDNALGRIVPNQKAVQSKAEQQPVQEVDRRPPPPEVEIEEEIEVDTDFDDIEELPAAHVEAADAPNNEAVTRILVESEVYVKYGLKQKAIEHIAKIFALVPNHREAYTRYKSLLVDTGATDEAAEALLSMAAAAIEGGDRATASADLQELLALVPSHQRGRELLAKLDPAAAKAAAAPAPQPAPDDDLEITEELGDDYVPEVESSGGAAAQTLSYEPSEQAAEIDLDVDDEEMVGVEIAADESDLELDSGVIVGGELAAEETDLDADGGIIIGVEDDADAGITVGLEDDADEGITVGLEDDADKGITVEIGETSYEAPIIPDRAAAERALHFEEDQPSIELETPPAVAAKPAVAEVPVEPEKPAAPAKPAAAARASAKGAALDADLDALINSAVPARRKTDSDPLGISKKNDAAKEEAAKAEAAQAAAAAQAEAARAEAARAEAARGEAARAEAAQQAAAPADLSAEVAEVGFYLEQGLEDEAREMVTTLLADNPGHPDLLALQAKLDGTAAPPLAVAALDYEPEPEMQMGDMNDIVADLQSAAADDNLQVELDDVFDAFKKGVAESVEEADYATHYDLGIAYKEMDLLPDAIREFELAARDPTRQIGALTMMGLCALQSGDIENALAYFQRGLNSQSVTPAEAMALRYEIGVAYEGAGRFGEAGKFYEKVHAWDQSFRDVDERLSRTREQGDGGGEVVSELDELLSETDAERASRNKISYV